MGSFYMRIDDLGKGLYIAGPRDTSPTGTLRRARGIHSVPFGTAVRSRDGSVKLYDIDAHSLYRFADARFAGAGTSLFRDGMLIESGFNGSRLSFARIPPTVDAENAKPDYMFVSGGGHLVKVDADGNVSEWGFDGPDDGVIAATIQERRELQIESCDDASTFTPVGTVNKTNDAVNRQERDSGGSFVGSSMRVHMAPSETAIVYKDLTTLNLTEVGTPPVASPDEDFIVMWCMVDEPTNLDSIEIALKVDTATFDAEGNATDTYAFQLTPGEIHTRTFGVSMFMSEAEIERLNKKRDGKDDPAQAPDTATPRKLQSSHHVSDKAGEWVRVRVSKADFHRAGTLDAKWDKITGIRFTIKTNSVGGVDVWFDDVRLYGSVGMQGDYRHQVTFYNSVTGHRSNANPTEIVTKDVDRQGILLSGLPTSAPDPQIDSKEIWRCVGDGVTLFRAAIIPLAQATYLDEVADYIGLHGDAGHYLEPLALQYDNAKPDSDFTDCAVFQGRMWWVKGDGRIYYSPAGRPESVKGFVETAHPDEPMMKLTVWNRQLYAWGEAHPVMIVGTGEPFSYDEFKEVPGTTAPYTVTGTPVGIFYLATDGPRLFDGAQSSLEIARAVLPLFRGHETEAAFNGIIAEYGRGEVLGSDGFVTLGLSVQGLWRDVGVGCKALYYEPDTSQMIASFNGAIYALEVEGREDDDGTPIAFDVETPTPKSPDMAHDAFVRMVLIDIDTQGEQVRPTLVYDDLSEIMLPVFQTSARQTIEYARLDTAHLVGVRLTAALHKRVTWFGVELDPYVGARVESAPQGASQ